MLYQKNIGYLSQRFRWPTWVRYNYSFRQEAADLGKLDWSQLASLDTLASLTS